MSEAASSRRLSILIQGRVQGVGFRPFVYRLAKAHALSGLVRNQRGGVCCEVEGPAEAVSAFVEDLRRRVPRAAQIDTLETIGVSYSDSKNQFAPGEFWKKYDAGDFGTPQ